MSRPSPRKIVKGKRVLPSVPPESPRLKSVTFNDDIVETSIGGTQRVGKIKKDIFFHFENPTSIKDGPQSKALSSNGFKTSVPQGKENKEIANGACHATLNGSSLSQNKKHVNSIDGVNCNGNNSSFIEPLSAIAKSKVVERIPPSVVKSKSDSKPPLQQEVLTSMKKESSISTTSATIGKDEACYEEDNSNGKINDNDDSKVKSGVISIVKDSPFRTPTSKQARRHTLESRLFATPDCYRDVNLGTPRRMLPAIQDESMEVHEDGEDSCSITVAVRVRPYSQR